MRARSDAHARDRDAIRCGRISYTNALPVYAAFDAGAVRFPGQIVCGTPADLNAMLLAGRLDMGPVSAAFWARHGDELVLLPDLCIGARDAVWSVVCISAEPLGALDGKTVAVTRESASGRDLLRVILERRHGARATFAESDDAFEAAQRGEAALLIGDRALDARLTFPSETVHDLGHEWHAWTGEDIVFAVWAARRDDVGPVFPDDALGSFAPANGDAFGPSGDVLTAPLEALTAPPGLFGRGAGEPSATAAAPSQFPCDAPSGIATAWESLLAARAWGERHAEDVVAAAEAMCARPPGFYAGYFRHLNYSFDQRARAGLTRFLTELCAVGVLSAVPSTEPEAAFVSR